MCVDADTAATATFHIRSVVAIRHHLRRDLVHRLWASLVISRLHYCNAVITELPTNALSTNLSDRALSHPFERNFAGYPSEEALTKSFEHFHIFT